MVWILICKIRIAVVVNLYVTKYNTLQILSILVTSNKNYKVLSFSWKVKKSEIRLLDSLTTLSEETVHEIILKVSLLKYGMSILSKYVRFILTL